jgi:hypothetical protein
MAKWEETCIVLDVDVKPGPSRDSKGRKRANSVALSPDGQHAAFVYDKEVQVSRIAVIDNAVTQDDKPSMRLSRREGDFHAAVCSNQVTVALYAKRYSLLNEA